jgi:hypothetical protein
MACTHTSTAVPAAAHTQAPTHSEGYGLRVSHDGQSPSALHSQQCGGQKCSLRIRACKQHNASHPTALHTTLTQSPPLSGRAPLQTRSPLPSPLQSSLCRPCTLQAEHA